MQTIKTWFITGASRGIGFELVQQLLQQGQRVAATSRDVTALQAAVGDSTNFLPLRVDLASEASVNDAIRATIVRFGPIDVVVNNAGYGQLGSLEELSDEESRVNFDVNVFGTLNVIRQVMPHLRRRQRGHIINIASIAGLIGGFAGWGVYCATKFAVVGLSEALAAETAPHGIKVTIVEPGYVRTNFLSAGSLRLAARPLNAYTLVRESEAFHQEKVVGNQPGDPVKVATAIINVAGESNPPLHLLLGQDAYDLATAKLRSQADEMAQWKHVTMSTGFTTPALEVAAV